MKNSCIPNTGCFTTALEEHWARLFHSTNYWQDLG